VNQARHNREVAIRCTKYPPQFAIDLLIDDSEGVRLESERHAFAMLVVDPADEEWVAKVKMVVAEMTVAQVEK
jgi:hypothetical protein